MIQKSRPAALLQPQDVGDRVETLMVNCGDGKAGFQAAGSGRRPGGSLFRAPDAQSWGLVGTDDGEEGGEDRSASFAWDGRAKVALPQWYPLEMGGIAGALEGFGEMCPRGRERDAIAAGRCLELDALSNREDSWASRYLGHLQAR